MQFFASYEVAQAQILSREFYQIRISEVQTKFRKVQMPFLFYFELPNEKYYGCYDLVTKRVTKYACGDTGFLGCI